MGRRRQRLARRRRGQPRGGGGVGRRRSGAAAADGRRLRRESHARGRRAVGKAAPRRPSATSLELLRRSSTAVAAGARWAQAAEADATAKVAGKPIGKIAAADPLLRGDAGPPARRKGEAHAAPVRAIIFGTETAPALDGHRAKLPATRGFQGTAGLDSHAQNRWDPYVVRDGAASGTPLKGEAAGATTYKSPMDEVLYGRDYDQSGDYKSIREGIAASSEFGGAAGLSSFAESKKAPLHRVETNTDVHTTFAKVEAGEPRSAEPIHKAETASKRIIQVGEPGRPHSHFAEKGVAAWVSGEAGSGSWGATVAGSTPHPGRDEDWRPWRKPERPFGKQLPLGW